MQEREGALDAEGDEDQGGSKIVQAEIFEGDRAGLVEIDDGAGQQQQRTQALEELATTETVENVDIRVDRLIRDDGTSWDDNFNIGDVVFIDLPAVGTAVEIDAEHVEPQQAESEVDETRSRPHLTIVK